MAEAGMGRELRADMMGSGEGVENEDESYAGRGVVTSEEGDEAERGREEGTSLEVVSWGGREANAVGGSEDRAAWAARMISPMAWGAGIAWDDKKIGTGMKKGKDRKLQISRRS
jgi:hypothetical protein